MHGNLATYFTAVAAKRLSAVEADPKTSNQHEFNGVTGLLDMLGADRRPYPARFVYLSDGDEAPTTDDATLTWYDARENHPTRSEYRLYFPRTAVSERMAEGDLAVFALTPEGRVFVFVAPASSTYASHLTWLFGLGADVLGLEVRQIKPEEGRSVGYAERLILEELGIAPREKADERWLEILTDRFGTAFPRTRSFSEFSRETAAEVDVRADPDMALLTWMEHEEMLFRLFENRLLEEDIRKGFQNVDAFISYSLSVQNRRKARAGLALENHVEFALTAVGLRFCRGCETENRKRPDFLFPGRADYIDPTFAAARLAILGVKSTLKDRWRQVLSEADRVRVKHLLTLEPAISEQQTSEMQAGNLQLVVPAPLHATYREHQQSWLMSFAEFIATRERA